MWKYFAQDHCSTVFSVEQNNTAKNPEDNVNNKPWKTLNLKKKILSMYFFLVPVFVLRFGILYCPLHTYLHYFYSELQTTERWSQLKYLHNLLVFFTGCLILVVSSLQSFFLVLICLEIIEISYCLFFILFFISWTYPY